MKLQQWLDAMDKLDREATPGPWSTGKPLDGTVYVGTGGPDGYNFGVRECDAPLVCQSRTELPRAVKILRWVLESYTGHNKGTVMDEIEKILGECG